jgi:hypothetical protein
MACVTIAGSPACGSVIDDSFVDAYPPAVADYVSIAQAPDGTFGMVMYDRNRGNLVGVSGTSGHFSSAILDGQTGDSSNFDDPNRRDTGDVGIASSLAVDEGGQWHVAYVNASTEVLQYLSVSGGDIHKPNAPEIVDDGTGLAGQPYGDGLHLVGDDATMDVEESGNLRILYQDATAGTLHVATATTTAGGKHEWALKAIAQPGRFAGFFPRRVPGGVQVTNWFRQTQHATSPATVVGDVAFVTP